MPAKLESLFDTVCTAASNLWEYSGREAKTQYASLTEDMRWCLARARDTFIFMCAKAAWDWLELEAWIVALGSSALRHAISLLLTLPWMGQITVGAVLLMLLSPILPPLWDGLLRVVQAITNRISMYAKDLLSARKSASVTSTQHTPTTVASNQVQGHTEFAQATYSDDLSTRTLLQEIHGVLADAFSNAERDRPTRAVHSLNTIQEPNITELFAVIKQKLEALMTERPEAERLNSIIRQIDNITSTSETREQSTRTLTSVKYTTARGNTYTPVTDTELDSPRSSSPFDPNDAGAYQTHI